MPTVNGLVGNNTILALTKGGTLVELSAQGKRRLLEPPSGFPSHRFDVDVVDQKIHLSWIDSGSMTAPPKKGVFAATLDNKTELLRFHTKAEVQSTCISHDNDEVWIAYTLTPQGFEPTDIWVAQLYGIANYAIDTKALRDEVDQIYLNNDGDKTVLILNLIDGSLIIYELGEEGARVCSSVQ